MANISSIGIGLGIIILCMVSIIIITSFEKYLSNTYFILGTFGALYFIYICFSVVLSKNKNYIKELNKLTNRIKLYHFLEGFYVNISNVKLFIFLKKAETIEI